MNIKLNHDGSAVTQTEKYKVIETKGDKIWCDGGIEITLKSKPYEHTIVSNGDKIEKLVQSIKVIATCEEDAYVLITRIVEE